MTTTPPVVPAYDAPPSVPSPAPPPPPWSAGRVVAFVMGSLLVLTSLGLLVGGGALLIAGATVRDDAGYLMTPSARVDSAGYAVVSESLELDAAGAVVPERWLGTVKVEASAPGSGEVFVGIAPTADVEAYLGDVARSVVRDLGGRTDDLDVSDVAGVAPSGGPAEQDFWTVSSLGQGTRSVTWDAEQGDWTMVVMTPAGSAPVSADVAVGATIPALDDVGLALLAVGLVTGGGAAVVLLATLRRRSPR